VSARDVHDLLAALHVPRNAILYVQSSADWIRKGGFDPNDVLPALREWIGPNGTLVMPSYPTRATHLEYLRGRPVFDVRHTPSAMGLITEMFRRAPGAARSLDPDFPISAEGGDADEIVRTDLSSPDPFGASSTYARLIARDATLVGLGVSLNTNSFIHVIDSSAQNAYRGRVYEAADYHAAVVDRDGSRHEVVRRALSPPFQQLTQPDAIADRLATTEPETLATLEIDGARFFRCRLSRWAEWCLTHTRETAVDDRLPCWLSRLQSF
jgi:aminoglycoside 3-N-acetyltransferase